MLLKPWSLELNSQEVDFLTSTFWIQVHGLPALWQKKENLKKIGFCPGKFLEVDFVEDGKPHWNRFIRVRVEINLLSPLLPGIFLPRPGHNDVWVGLKYKKLPELCYLCGIIGHLEKECNS